MRLPVHRKADRLTAAGFLLVLALMLALAVLGLSQVRAINARMEGLVAQHLLEMDLLHTMRSFVRERSLSLHAMYLTDDLFLRNEEFIRFTQLAVEFMDARAHFERANVCLGGRPGERPAGAIEQDCALERETYYGVLALIRRSQPLQAALAERIAGDRMAGVWEELVREDLPLEKEILALFDRLIDIKRDEVHAELALASRDYQGAVVGASILGGLLLLLGGAVAAYVIVRTRSMERALWQQKEQAEVTLNSVGDAVITADARGCVTYLNPVAEQLTGWTCPKAVGRPLREIYRIVNETTRRPLEHPAMLGCLDGRLVGLPHTALIGAHGREYAIEDCAAPLGGSDGEVSGSVLVFRDVTRSRRLEKQLSWQASHDPLTGLANRREFEVLLERRIRSAQERGKTHALLYLDLDQFKVVNDTCGHAAGDELLRQVAATLAPHVRAADTFARLGGDEFGVLLEACPISRAQAVAEKLREAVNDFRFVWQDKSFRLGVSIGLTTIDAGTVDVDDVLGAADAACYLAKEKGRNRLWIHEPGDAEVARRQGEMRWVAEINRAFDENRFTLCVQRIVPLAAPRGIALYGEVLVRLRGRDGEVIAPMAFIPAAERYGLMSAIDRWVIGETLAWLAGQSSGPGLAINLSSQSLGDEGLLGYVQERFAATGVDPRRVCFEITETAAIANWQRATHFVQTLKARGCRFALDDFGSGMSSFGYLKNLPVDFIKIDGAFVRDMERDPVDRALVESINHVGHVLGIATIAEFVEDDAVLKALRALGVDYAQGYALHHPEPLERLAMFPVAN